MWFAWSWKKRLHAAVFWKKKSSIELLSYLLDMLKVAQRHWKNSLQNKLLQYNRPNFGQVNVECESRKEQKQIEGGQTATEYVPKK